MPLSMSQTQSNWDACGMREFVRRIVWTVVDLFGRGSAQGEILTLRRRINAL
jgi:hypothetical protein